MTSPGPHSAQEWLITLPLPPADNHCHQTAHYGRYPTKAYKTWLDIAAPLLRKKLGNVQPDTTDWWSLHIWVWNKPRGYDVQNLIKPVCDLLSGAQVDDRQKIVKPGGLYDDDKRVKHVSIELCGTHDEDPRIIISAERTEPPVKWKKAKKRP